MVKMLTLLSLHLVALICASTHFTVLPGSGQGGLRIEYFRYFFQRSYGMPYQPAYSLQVVAAYLIAFAVGIAAYSAVTRRDSPVLGLSGILLCIVGLASFAFELSHWFVDHHWSWIASAPIALLVIGPAAAIQQFRRRAGQADAMLDRELAL